MTLQSTPVAADTRHHTDMELVRMTVAGDTHAFELIMRRHNALLFRIARSMLKNDADAEDALQDGYVKAWRSLSSFRDDAKLSTWLVRIVVNEALSRLRRPSASVVPIDGSATTTSTAEIISNDTLDENKSDHPESQAMSIQMRDMLERQIDTLPDAFRTVFVLRAVQELSVEETASALDIPEATVRSRFFRARSLLRESLAREVDVATSGAFAFDGVRCDRIVSSVTRRLAVEDQVDV